MRSSALNEPNQGNCHKTNTTLALPPLVNIIDGLRVAGLLDMIDYVECSAVTDTGMERLKEGIVSAALNGLSDSRQTNSCGCMCCVL